MSASTRPHTPLLFLFLLVCCSFTRCSSKNLVDSRIPLRKRIQGEARRLAVDKKEGEVENKKNDDTNTKDEKNKDEKNKDKNKNTVDNSKAIEDKNANKQPTTQIEPPTVSPEINKDVPTVSVVTTSDPTVSPTVSHTVNPTLKPNSSPSTSPTSSPTHFKVSSLTLGPTITTTSAQSPKNPKTQWIAPSPQINELIMVEFSIMMKKGNGMTGEDILKGINEELSNAMSTAVTNILCKGTDIIVRALEQDNLCQNTNRFLVRRGTNSLSKDPPTVIFMDSDQFITRVIEKTSETNRKISWFQIRAQYQVLSVSDKYLKYVGTMEPREMVEEIAQSSVTKGIMHGSMLELLNLNDGNIRAVSIIGMEDNVFKEAYYEKALAVNGFNSSTEESTGFILRITGIVVLTLTLSFLAVIFLVGRRRKKEWEVDHVAKHREKLQNMKADLTTEGVDVILHEGRCSRLDNDNEVHMNGIMI